MAITTSDKVIGKLALPVIALACGLLVLVFVLTIKSSTKENNAYIRVINCVISIPARTRTQEDIEQCYVVVEKDLDVKLQRYDTSGYQR